MNLIFLISLIVFPLNVWLVAKPAFLVGDNLKNTSDFVQVESQAEDQGGNVRGAEGARKEEIFKRYTAVPIRNPKIADLVLPNAHASIIIDVESGTIMHYKNGKEKRPIASLSKIMTAVIVLEKVQNLEEIVVVDKESIYVEGTKIGCPRSGYCISPRLKVGEKITVLNLLKAMLMNSANDAAVILAKHIAETEENFVKLMNAKASQLELRDTHFCTASGLDVEGREKECYSSAYDIARIAAYSVKYELIWDILRLPTNLTIKSADGIYEHKILNTDLVLDQIPNCLGGKTGFTPAAGHSLLLGASDDTKKHKIIAVLLNDPYRWQDIRKMVDWAFRAYEWK